MCFIKIMYCIELHTSFSLLSKILQEENTDLLSFIFFKFKVVKNVHFTFIYLYDKPLYPRHNSAKFVHVRGTISS